MPFTMMRKQATGGDGAAVAAIVNTTLNSVVASTNTTNNANSNQMRLRGSMQASQQQSSTSLPVSHHHHHHQNQHHHHADPARPSLRPIVKCCMPWYRVTGALCCFYVVGMMLGLRFLFQQQHQHQQQPTLGDFLPGHTSPLEWMMQNQQRVGAMFLGNDNQQENNEKKRGRFIRDEAQVRQLQQWEQELGLISCRRRRLISGTVEYTAAGDPCSVVTVAGTDKDHENNSNDEDHPNQLITLFNPMHHERYLCRGKIRIEAHGTTQIDWDTWNARECRMSGTDHSNEDGNDKNDQFLLFASLFPVIPDITGRGMDAVTLRFGDVAHRLPTSPFTDCDIPCHHCGSPSVNSIRTIDHILATPTTNARGPPQGKMDDWRFTFSMEGPEYYPSLVMSTTAWRQGSFYATTSYLSEVPLPYFSWAEYKIQSRAVDFDQSEPAILFLARNCNSRNNREEVVRKLQLLHEQDPTKYVRIDSLSSCLNNASPPAGVNLNDKRQTMRRYRFYLAAENQCIDDYITEKLWGALESGTVPVYFGAPNVQDHAPPHSIIAVNDFPSTAALSQYLQQLAQNRTAYQEYHAWRKHPLPSQFHAKYDFTAIHSTCRMCRWAYARMYGVGWYHANQSLVSLQTPRQVCVDPDTGLLQHFIRDVSWSGIIRSMPTKTEPIRIMPLHVEPVLLQHDEMQDVHHYEDDPCDLYHHSRVLDLDYGQFRRTAVSVDGVLDVYLDHTNNIHEASRSWFMVQWRFELPFSVKGDDDNLPIVQVIEAGHVRVQTSISRITILSDPPSLQLQQQQDDDTSNSNSNSSSLQLMVDIPIDAFPVRMRFIVEDVDRNKMHHGADQAENFFGSVMKQDFVLPLEAFVEAVDNMDEAK